MFMCTDCSKIFNNAIALTAHQNLSVSCITQTSLSDILKDNEDLLDLNIFSIIINYVTLQTEEAFDIVMIFEMCCKGLLDIIFPYGNTSDINYLKLATEFTVSEIKYSDYECLKHWGCFALDELNAKTLYDDIKKYCFGNNKINDYERNQLIIPFHILLKKNARFPNITTLTTKHMFSPIWLDLFPELSTLSIRINTKYNEFGFYKIYPNITQLHIDVIHFELLKWFPNVKLLFLKYRNIMTPLDPTILLKNTPHISHLYYDGYGMPLVSENVTSLSLLSTLGTQLVDSSHIPENIISLQLCGLTINRSLLANLTCIKILELKFMELLGYENIFIKMNNLLRLTLYGEFYTNLFEDLEAASLKKLVSLTILYQLTTIPNCTLPYVQILHACSPKYLKIFPNLRKLILSDVNKGTPDLSGKWSTKNVTLHINIFTGNLDILLKTLKECKTKIVELKITKKNAYAETPVIVRKLLTYLPYLKRFYYNFPIPQLYLDSLPKGCLIFYTT